MKLILNFQVVAATWRHTVSHRRQCHRRSWILLAGEYDPTLRQSAAKTRQTLQIITKYTIQHTTHAPPFLGCIECWLFLPTFAVSVCLYVCLSVMWLKSAAARAVYTACAGSFGAGFAKCLWPLVCIMTLMTSFPTVCYLAVGYFSLIFSYSLMTKGRNDTYELSCCSVGRSFYAHGSVIRIGTTKQRNVKIWTKIS